MIGVIASPKIHSLHDSNIKYATSYVKWIESSGAKAMIIPYNISSSSLLHVLKRIRGVVFIGGAIENKKLYTHDQYVTYVNTIYHTYRIVKEYNDQGRYFPIWATCLGFEMVLLFNQHKSLEHLFDSMKLHVKNGPSTLQLLPSRIKSFFPHDIVMKMKTIPCVTHHHKYGFDIAPNEHFTIVSTDSNFINMFEFKKYPFYGSQFHPERHFDTFSKQISTLFSCFFYSECLKNEFKPT
jgi:gamma-glutamyl hydrolase